MRLKELVALKSNDYTNTSERFDKETAEAILSNEDTKRLELITESLSIVLPSYEVHKQLPHTLAHLNKQVYQNFEVLIVDDNSQPPLEKIIREQETNYPLKYIRVPYNVLKNPNHARNIGIMSSDSNNIVILDSDMIVAPSFTANLAIKQQFTEDCLFVGFRENVNRRNEVKGPADISKDWRHTVVIDDSFHDFIHVNINGEKHKIRGKLNILNKTNYFKDFGHGKSLAYWDLPSMVIGHCIAFNRQRAIKAGGFPEIFFGWGIDDIAFGANMIANDQYIIPSLNTVNYHIIHRSKTDFKKSLTKLKANIERYFDYANLDFSPRFPSYKVRQYDTEPSKKYFLEIVKK